MVFHQVEHVRDVVDYCHLEDRQSHWSWNQMDLDLDLDLEEVLEMGF
jgi:hypothetical protein